MNTTKTLLFYSAATFILFACGNKQETVDRESDLIEITSPQFKTGEMQLGETETRAFQNIVKCNGTIVPLPKGMAKLSAPLNGMIRDIYCFNGQLVEKNQRLLEITGNELIDLQKEFADASAHFRRLKNEYERMKSLYDEKVTAEKDFILAESDFKASMARYYGLKLKIETIGLSISKIGDGEFYSSYALKSPIRGYITSLNTSIGSYIDSQTNLLEIINPDMLQVRLSLFLTDIKHVKKGQSVRFKSVKSAEVNFATISSVGTAIDDETKTIECYATLTDIKNTNPLAYELVESEIIISTDTVLALPGEALIKTETGTVVLMLEKQENDTSWFKKVDIKIGRQHNGYTEILTENLHGQILTKGAYNVFQ